MRFALIYASLLAASGGIALMTVQALGIVTTDDSATCALVLLAYGCAWGARVLDGKW